MDKKTSKIPVYVVTGFLFSGKTSLINEQLKLLDDNKHVLVVQFESGKEKIYSDSVNVLYISKRCADSMTDEEIAIKIVDSIYQYSPKMIWVEWNGMNDMLSLDSIFSQKKLCRLCAIMNIMYVAVADSFKSTISGTGGVSQIQLSQSDLLVLRNTNSNPKDVQIKKMAKSLSKNIAIVDDDDTQRFKDSLKIIELTNLKHILLGFLILEGIMIFLQLFGIELSTAAAVFLGTWLQAIPFLLLGILLSSAIQVFLSAEFIKKVFPQKLIPGLFFGILGGFCLPVCDCVSIPVFRSLVKKGVPLPAATAFMCAAPVINPVVMISTYYAYNGNIKMVIARVTLGIICSLAIAFCFVKYKGEVLSKEVQSSFCTCGCCAGTNYMSKSKLVQFIGKSEAEFFEVGKYLLIGIGVSTFFQLALDRNINPKSDFGLSISILIMMLFAFLLSLCSSSDAVVGKGLGAGLPLGATMGFLIFGPMMDIKNLILMSGSFSKKFALKLLFVCFAMCFIIVFLTFYFGLERVLV